MKHWLVLSSAALAIAAMCPEKLYAG